MTAPWGVLETSCVGFFEKTAFRRHADKNEGFQQKANKLAASYNAWHEAEGESKAWKWRLKEEREQGAE